MAANPKIDRMVALLRVACAAPAVLMRATAPVAAAMPGLHLVSMCTAEGPRLSLVEGEDPIRPQNRHDQGQMACAHMLCPREILPERKTRRRA
jgi:hypothetical protein